MPGPPPDYVTGSEFKRWMDEESGFRERIERRMMDGFTKLDGAIVRVENQVREANGKTAEHARIIAVMQRDVEAIRSEDLDIEAAVRSIKEEGCSQYVDHVKLLGMSEADGGPKIRTWMSRLNRPQKTAAAAAVLALLLPAVVDLAKIVADTWKWLEQLHHGLVQ